MEDDIASEVNNQPNYAFFVRVNAGGINLSKFTELDRLALHISSGRVIKISEARKKIREIVSAETLYQVCFTNEHSPLESRFYVIYLCRFRCHFPSTHERYLG
jgi:hypothetical protein